MPHLQLLADARLRGCFARLVGDDRIRLEPRNGALLAAPHPAIAGLVERRTQPPIRLPHEARCRVRLVVDLAGPAAPLPRLPDAETGLVALLGVAGLAHLRMAGPPHALWCGIVFDRLAALGGGR